MGSDLTFVSFDIETTGFSVDETVTVLGFAMPLGCRVFLNSDNRPVETARLQDDLSTQFNTTVNLSTHQCEREMFESFNEFCRGNLTAGDYLVTAFHGDIFSGGFDLPFLRSKFTRLDCEWPFIDLPYTDLFPVFDARFNTTLDEDDASDLVQVYEVLVGGELTARDPFEDSGEAVTAFHRGEFGALLQHNVADILRTDALATVAERYCSKSDFQMKSLTPAIQSS